MQILKTWFSKGQRDALSYCKGCIIMMDINTKAFLILQKPSHSATWQLKSDMVDQNTAPNCNRINWNLCNCFDWDSKVKIASSHFCALCHTAPKSTECPLQVHIWQGPSANECLISTKLHILDSSLLEPKEAKRGCQEIHQDEQNFGTSRNLLSFYVSENLSKNLSEMFQFENAFLIN